MHRQLQFLAPTGSSLLGGALAAALREQESADPAQNSFVLSPDPRDPLLRDHEFVAFVLEIPEPVTRKVAAAALFLAAGISVRLGWSVLEPDSGMSLHRGDAAGTRQLIEELATSTDYVAQVAAWTVRLPLWMVKLFAVASYGITAAFLLRREEVPDHFELQFALLGALLLGFILTCGGALRLLLETRRRRRE